MRAVVRVSSVFATSSVSSSASLFWLRTSSVPLIARNASGVENALFVVGTTRMGTPGATNTRELHSFFHNNKLGIDNGEELVVIMFEVIRKGTKSVAYPYTLKPNEEVPESLRDMYTARSYA